jgi:hypothetical protein
MTISRLLSSLQISVSLQAGSLYSWKNLYVGNVAPWGPYISFSLSEGMKAPTQNAFYTQCLWWSKGKIQLSQGIKVDLQFLCDYLL